MNLSNLYKNYNTPLTLFYITFTLLISIHTSANDLLKYGTPFIKHFTKQDYKAGNQNWAMTQDNEGFIYVGNSNGLLQFDGIRWKKYQLAGSPIIRAVFADNNRIYSGSLGEFGYWEKDNHLNLSYTSISASLKNHEFGDEEIWWIIKHNNNIIFQSFSNTFLYDGNSVKKILADVGVIFPPFSVNGRLFIQAIDHGIYEVTEQSTKLIPNSELFVKKPIKMIEPFSNTSTILIGTESDGFFIYNNHHFHKWNITDEEVFKQNKINRGLKITDKLFAIGTILGGVFILDEKGVLLSQINNKRGLNNNTVLSLMLDKNSNLWVGLDNGLDLIKMNAPLYHNSDISGNIGAVYTSAIHQNYLYLGTNRGVFYKELSQATNNFTLIPGSQGQIWNLSVIDNTLFCGHNTFTYTIKEGRFEQISHAAGGYDFKRYPFKNQCIIQGGYGGLSVYQKQGEKWTYAHSIKGFTKLSKIVAVERENIVWVSHPYQGLFRLELSEDLTSVTGLRAFSHMHKTYINRLNNKIIFSSDSGFVYYDDIQHSFHLLTGINKALGDFSKNAHLHEAVNNNYWIFKDGNCAKAIMDEENVTAFDNVTMSNLNGFLMPGHENIDIIDSTYTIIYLDNGYAIFDNNWADNSENWQPKISLRALNFSTLSGKIYAENTEKSDIPFSYNNIKLQFAFPEYVHGIDLVYKLEGYNEKWNKMNYGKEINFQNLSFGNYSFKIKPENGAAESELVLHFTINPPWYKSVIAQVIYSVLFLILLVVGIVWNKRKIRRIHQKHELERKQLLEKEAEENEKKLIKIRNENLRNEIKLRNSRLAKSTFSLIQKNKTLITVKNELTKIKEELGVRFPSKHFNRIIRNIDKDITSTNDWKMFEQSFNEVHGHFLHQLKKEFPELTPTDFQLCAYLKMNLSSKEIASLLNISIRGVEVRRYRLRKKLQLPHDANLVEFILNY